jgi:hypothetical protein
LGIVEELQSAVRHLNAERKTALATEYQNAISVLTGRVLATSGDFPNVISDLRAIIQFEQDNTYPNQSKVREYTDAISKLENGAFKEG